MSALLYRLGGLCLRHRRLVLALWALGVVAVAAALLHYGSRINNNITLPGTDTQRASALIARKFPAEQYDESPIVFHTASASLRSAANRQAIAASLRNIGRLPHVSTVIGPFSAAGRDQLSADGTTAIAEVLMNINGFQIDRDLAARVLAGAGPARRAGLQVEAGGTIGETLSETSTRPSELVGIVAAIVILTYTFGCLVAAGLPILTALVGLGTGLALIGLLGHLIDIPTDAPKVATMIGLGVGIDYALFIVFRQRDQLHAGMAPEESLPRTMASSGSAVVFAGCTVIIALLALLVAGVPILGALGYAAAIAVGVAVLGAVTLLPALLGVLGSRIDGLAILRGRRRASAAAEGGLWARWVVLVTAHPWRALIIALCVMVPLALPVLTLKLGQEDIGVTPTATTERRAFDLISAGLGAGANGPLVVAAELHPQARPSAAYLRAQDQARRLQDELAGGGRRLVRQAVLLRAEQVALRGAAAQLQQEPLELTGERGDLAEQADVLQTDRRSLSGAQADLAAAEAHLAAASATLAAKGQALEKQITALRLQIAGSQNAGQIAQLQARLAGLLSRLRSLQADGAALKRKAAALRERAGHLEVQGAALAAQAASLSAAEQSLAARSIELQQQDAALHMRGRHLTRRAGLLAAQRRHLHRDARRGMALRATLVGMLTRAGGDPRATDPRVVRLQKALAASRGVVSVSPPRISPDGAGLLLSVTSATRPAAPATVALVQRLRSQVIPAAVKGSGMTAYVGGATAAYVDLATLISRRLPLVIACVLALSFALLLLAFRSLLVPLKAILCNLLAVSAAFGVLTVVFQWGLGLRLIGQSNPYGTVPIVSYVPLLMFAVLFGMSTDYEVFLISQIFQFHAAGRRPSEAVRLGVATSARVITAAAAIMVVVFASFTLNGDPMIKQFGVGLSIAILLDASIVRMVIVPATMVLLGEWNWYLPGWLQWLPRIDLPEERMTAGAAQPATPREVLARDG